MSILEELLNCTRLSFFTIFPGTAVTFSLINYGLSVVSL